MSKSGSKDLHDPKYEAILRELLAPYIEYAREWWGSSERRSYPYAVCRPLRGELPGLYEKCCRSPTQSVVPGVQSLLIVKASVLQYPPNIPGGAISMTERLIGDGMVYDEFTLIIKKALHSTASSGKFICVVPTRLINSKNNPRWVYMKQSEIDELALGRAPAALVERVIQYRSEDAPTVSAQAVTPVILKERVPFG